MATKQKKKQQNKQGQKQVTITQEEEKQPQITIQSSQQNDNQSTYAEISSQQTIESLANLTKNQAKKEKKKKKKNATKSAIDIKRKLSVDPNQGGIKFLNLKPPKEKPEDTKQKNKDENNKNDDDEENEDDRSQSQSGHDSSDPDENEDFIDYKPDGYHPMHEGEILDSRYIVLKKLGWGHFSTVWLAFNLSDKKLYALKIIRSHKKYLSSAYDEEAICKIIADNYQNSVWVKSVRQYLNNPALSVNRDHTHCLQMFDWFNHHGENGRHFTMAFEVLGRNLLSLVKKYDYRGIPLPIVREITKQLLMALDYMHRVCKIIHTDLKPENITFQLREEEQFDLLYKYVLCTPLVDLFETQEKIILNKKQQKNQKKKDRKKKKKQQQTTKVEEEEKEEQDEENENETEKQESTAEQQASKAIKVIGEMRNKLIQADKQYFIAPKRRNVSELTRSKEKLLTSDEKMNIQEHPLKNQQNRKPKEYLRMNSQTHLWSDMVKFNEYKPMDDIDVKAIKEMQFKVKIVDMGNACYIDEHFSDIIQTRQYRSPEVIFRGDYDQSADMWSLACTVFELVTGDYLFEPKKGRTFTKNEDHLALISELLGECKNSKFLNSGYKSDNGRLKNIKKLKYWGLRDVLIEKYRLREFEATELTDFLMKMLKWEPKDRATAQEMLQHPWLKMMPNYSTKMSRRELREFKRVNKYSQISDSTNSDQEQALDNEQELEVKDDLELPSEIQQQENKRND
ncbi:serine threonine protein kinase [Stylonychia lemnae]|uniref:non-specific serine/threonine protein kinase n=1 Tax=Stylonychia lemnae TaxID=5949 RepID=A0A078AAW7_STYLE|nr:serine threonine protein kinase [Stylonychia lemnae]|eukprot:CDW77938.1 serine threonine protein kinase [Stylonychia lemnae]